MNGKRDFPPFFRVTGPHLELGGLYTLLHGDEETAMNNQDMDDLMEALLATKHFAGKILAHEWANCWCDECSARAAERTRD